MTGLLCAQSYLLIKTALASCRTKVAYLKLLIRYSTSLLFIPAKKLTVLYFLAAMKSYAMMKGCEASYECCVHNILSEEWLQCCFKHSCCSLCHGVSRGEDDRFVTGSFLVQDD